MRALDTEGVTTIFGYPGGAIMPVYDALYQKVNEPQATLRHILVRHEQAAAHAAEGYARVSGEVGVCLVTSGPGATNTLTGVADAMMDSTPIVVIAGQVGTGSLGTDAFQEVDLVGVAGPISKWSYQIRRADDIAWAVSKAFYIARSGRPGPVVLDFTRNAQCEQTQWQPTRVSYVRSYEPSPAPDADAIARAAALIDAAERPMALVGQGVELGGAYKELTDFLERADMPAARTLLGLSALPTDHPLNVGMLGMHGNYAPNVKQQECDVLVAVGMRFSDRVTGKISAYAPKAKIIHIDIDPSEIDKNVKTDVAIVADCREALPMLTALIKEGHHRQWRDSFAPYAERERAEVITPATHPAEGPLLMGEVVNAVADASSADTVMVNDVGENQMFSSRYFRYHQPRSIITSGGLGTMGFGLPAAIGATTYAPASGPNRPVVLFTGDGGLQMSIQEFGTIMEQRLPVKIFLLNNSYLGNVRQWQDLMYEGRHSFTRMLNPRYEDICRGYGIAYSLAADRATLHEQIRRALEAEGPYLLECAVAECENIQPMVMPGTANDEMKLVLRKLTS